MYNKTISHGNKENVNNLNQMAHALKSKAYYNGKNDNKGHYRLRKLVSDQQIKVSLDNIKQVNLDLKLGSPCAKI